MKKQVKNYLLGIIKYSIWTLSVNAQKTILPVNSYGVWDRSNAYDISVNSDYNYLKGKSADVNWEDVQLLHEWVPYLLLKIILKTLKQ
jgi:hypothetical protein